MRLPDRDLIRVQKCFRLVLWEDLLNFPLQVSSASVLVSEVIWRFSWLISGSVGLVARILSLRVVRRRTWGERPGVKFL